MNKKVRKDFNALFSSKLGIACLEHLRSVTIEREEMPLNGDGMQSALILARRSGENNIVRYIEKLIRLEQADGK